MAAWGGADLLWAGEKQATASWPEITEEERNLKAVPQDPEADAVVLFNDRNGEIVREGDDWVNRMDYHWRLKVLTERGRRYDEVRIRAEKYSRVINIRGRTIKSDGTVVQVPPEQIFEKILFQRGGIKYSEWVFKFPGVEPGAILEYAYERRDDFLMFIDPWNFAKSEFTLRSKLTQTFPVGMVYMVLCDHCGSAKPEDIQWHKGKNSGRKYTMELHDIPSYREEEFMPPPRIISPRLEMVLQYWKRRYWEPLGRQDELFSDWASIARFFGTTYEEGVRDGQQAMRPVVAGWVGDISDREQMIKKIVEHVQRDFRYFEFSSIPLRPDPIESLLKFRLADNGEKAVLLVAALRTIGIKAQIALVSGNDAGSLNRKFFSPSQFTHAVVTLSGPDGESLWLDPTVTYAPFGFLPWTDVGADALLLEGIEGEMIKLPKESKVGATRYTSMVKPRTDGRTEVDVDAEFTGQDAIDMRDELTSASGSDQEAFVKKWLLQQHPGAVLLSHVLESLDNADEPLHIKMSFEAPRMVTMTEDLLLLQTCTFDCTEVNPISRRSRLYPFYLDRGWDREESITLLAPPGMVIAEVPAPATAKSAIADFSMECTAQGSKAVLCQKHFRASRNRWPAGIQSNLRNIYEVVVEADRSTIAFRKASGSGETGS